MQQAFVSLVLVIYPIAVLSIPKVNGLLTGILALTGIFYLLFSRQHRNQISRDEAWLYFAMVSFFSITLLATLNSGFTYGATGKFLHLLLFVPLYIFLRHTGINLGFLWYGLVAGSVVTAGLALYEIEFAGALRVRSITHPIIFGDLSLLMGCMALAGIGWFKERANWQVILPVIALLCAVLSSVLSVSRGAWIAVPFILLIFFWYFKHYFSWRQKALIYVSVLVFMAALYLIPQTGVSHHIERTVTSYNEYKGSEITSIKRDTSIGGRFEMWQAAWKIYTDNPILGVGWKHFQENAQKQVDQGLRNKAAAYWPHPHSQYLSVLASGGTFSFIFLMVLFFVPIKLFVKYINHSKSADVRRLALAGLLLVVSYMVFGFSEVMFERSRPVNFYSFYLAVFFAAIATVNRSAVADSSEIKK